MEEIAELFSSGGWLFDVFIQVLASVDLLSDIIVLVQYMYLFCGTRTFDGYGFYVAGIIIWSIHGYFRLSAEGFYFIHRKRAGIHKAWRVSMWFLGIYASMGTFILFEKMLRVLLCPLDIFLGIGYYTSVGEWKYMVADNLFWLTSDEKDYFKSLSGPKKYLDSITNLLAGTRWKIPLLLDTALEKRDDDNVLKQVKTLIIVAIVEEVMENLGGILMAIALTSCQGEGMSGLALFSIVTAIISSVVETGKYIGETTKVGKRASRNKKSPVEDKPDSRDCAANDDEEQVGMACENETDDFVGEYKTVSLKTHFKVNRDGSVTVRILKKMSNGSSFAETENVLEFPDANAASCAGYYMKEGEDF